MQRRPFDPMVRCNRSGARVSLALASALGVFALAGDAKAQFCRSTSCKDTASHTCQLDDNQCPAEGAPLAWPTSCLSFAMNERGTVQIPVELTKTVIHDSFQAWASVICPDGQPPSLKFLERAPVECHKSEYNQNGPNVNVVLFQDDNWIYRGIDGTLAKTSVTFNDQGVILDADIEVNSASNALTIGTDDVKYDLQSILTHEIGHFIGIAHSPNSSAVMYFSYNPGDISRTLQPDDIAAICAIYPSTKQQVCNAEPRNGFNPTCDDTISAGPCAVAPRGESSSYAVVAIGAVLGGGVLTARRRRRPRA